MTFRWEKINKKKLKITTSWFFTHRNLELDSGRCWMHRPMSPWRRLRNIYFQLLKIDREVISLTVDLRNPFDNDTLDRWLKVKINGALNIIL